MDRSNEKLADITAMIRDFAKAARAFGAKLILDADDLADRIDAAAKREELQWAKANGELAHMLDCEKAQGGHAAKLRQALQMFVDSVEWLCDGNESGRIKRQFAVLLSDSRAALAAPPRNCDRYATAEGANEAWFDYKASTAFPPGGWQDCDLLDWLFSPAAQEGGDHAETC